MKLPKRQQMNFERIESDALGECRLPVDALYGIHSLRGKQNFNYSGETLAAYPEFVAWLARTKMAIAKVNMRNGKLCAEKCVAVVEACQELVDGRHADALIVDPLEGACGTSINMNVNEVIANRALQILGHQPGQYEYLHPLDDVNFAQSTSDVVITAVKLTLREETERLSATIEGLAKSLREKQKEFHGILRIGRTCLQDALPMRLDQAFGGYASMTERSVTALRSHLSAMSECVLGGTAVGTGLGTYPGYRQTVTEELAKIAGRSLTQSLDLFDAIQNTDVFAALSSTAKTTALAIAKVANDLVLLSSGPTGGIGELKLAAHQAGSSMMPGKVNPVHAMGLTQVAYYVAGADQSVMLASAGGQLETNNYVPLVATSLIKSLSTLRRAVTAFDEQCVRLLTANRRASERNLLGSTAIAPALKAVIGYDGVAALVGKALASSKSLVEVVVADGVLSEERVLDLLRESSEHPDVRND